MVHSTDSVCVDFDPFLAYFAQIGQKPTFLGFWYSTFMINTQAWIDCVRYCTNHVYINRFSRLRFCVYKRKKHPAFCVLNAFYYQTDFNLRFKRKRDVRLTCKRVWCILHRTLSIQWLCPVTSHIIAQIDLTSGFGNISFEWN